MSRTDEAMSQKELWNEMRSVAFNRDFKEEIRVFREYLKSVKEVTNSPHIDSIEQEFINKFLVVV